MEEIEKKFKCPFCGEKITFLIDLSVAGSHSYVEDCEVCCRAIQVSFTVENDRIVAFSAEKAFD